MNFFKKLLKTFFNLIIILIIVIVILVLYNYFQITIRNKNYTNFFGYTFFEVITGSMKGTIEIHDVIVVKITRRY